MLQLITGDDIQDLTEISKATIIDYIAVPFINTADDITKIRATLGNHGKDIKILAKIDTLEGVKNYNQILTAADGIIFVRNELQFELQSEKLMIA